MIGKPEWFTRRKYSGWGLTPKTWQGVVYIVAILVPFIIFQALPFWSIQTRMIGTMVWLAILLLDVADIMLHLKLDEREKRHEAIAERNSLWIILAVIVVGILYETFNSAMSQTFSVNPFLIAALVLGMLTKAISNFYLDRRD